MLPAPLAKAMFRVANAFSVEVSGTSYVRSNLDAGAEEWGRNQELNDELEDDDCGPHVSKSGMEASVNLPD